MYNRYGMHGPNKDPTAISSMVALGMDCYTVVDKWEQVNQIRAARPNALILLRPFFAGGMANDPVLTAQRSCDHAIQFLDKTLHLVVGNELNIEGPFEALNPDSWKKMNEWVLKTVEVVRKNLPQAILHFPAISPGVGDDPDIMNPPGLGYCREAIEACDILDQHVYWPGRSAPSWAWEQRFEDWYGRRMKWHHALFPNKYLFLSECGPDDVRPLGTAEDIIEWFRILEDEFAYVLGGSLFMWNWGLENDYLNYYDKPYITGPLRDAEKKRFELPKTWVFDEGPEPPGPPPSPEGNIAEWLLEGLDKHLPPWSEWVGYNPHTSLTRAARDAGLGLAISGELRKPRDDRMVICQYFWKGLTWCYEYDYDNVRVIRY